MIIDLLILLTALAIGALAGILLTVRRYEHRQAERQADEDHLAEVRELYTAWAMIRRRNSGDQGPSGHDPCDRTPV
jgi:type II secretory pathway component PulJ